MPEREAIRLRPPKQARSRRTLERILEATEDLLEERPLDSISVADVVRRAGTSVGAFYTRFPNKGALLPALYARRHGSESLARSRRYLEAFAERPMSLKQRAAEVVRHMITYYVENRRLLEQMDLEARRGSERVAADARKHREAFHDGWAAAFLSHESKIAHPEPETAVRFALFVVSTACQDAIVFPSGAAGALSREELATELSRTLVSYLTAS